MTRPQERPFNTTVLHVWPYEWLKCLRRLPAVQNPLLAATVSIDRSLTSRRRCASWTRWRSNHWYGVVPVAATNRRAKVLGLIADRAARSSTVTTSSRCSCTQATVREEVGVIQYRQRLFDVARQSGVVHHIFIGNGLLST